MHHVYAKAGMANQHIFKQERAGQPRPVLGKPAISCSGRTLPHMNTDRDVQLLGEGEIGFE